MKTPGIAESRRDVSRGGVVCSDPRAARVFLARWLLHGVLGLVLASLSGCLVELVFVSCPRVVDVGQEFVMAIDVRVSGNSGGGVGVVLQLPDSVEFRGAQALTPHGRRQVRRNIRVQNRYQAERGHHLVALIDSLPTPRIRTETVRLFVRLLPKNVGEYSMKFTLVATTDETERPQWQRLAPPGVGNFASVVDSPYVLPIQVRAPEQLGLYALQFSGSRQYAALADSGAMALTLDSSFSVEMWLKTTARDMPLISTRRDDLTTAFPLDLRITEMGTVQIAASDGMQVSAMDGTHVVSDGTWHHVAVVYDASMPAYLGFIDGEPDGRMGLPAGIRGSGTGMAFLGTSPPRRRFFTGIIDEMRWWSTARSRGQISAQKNLMLSGYEQGLVAWYPFEAGDDSVIANGAQSGGFDAIPYNNPRLVESDLPFISEVLPFYAVLQGDTVTMTWETYDEKNVESYEVERRTESGKYAGLVVVPPQRLPSGRQQYRHEERFGARSVEYYRLRRNAMDGTVIYSDEFAVGAERFHNFVLGDSQPEPFLYTVTIPFQLKEATFVSLRVYDQLGRLVGELVSKRLPAGEHSAELDATDLPPGTYFYRLKTAKGVQTRKMLRAEDAP